MNPTPFNPDVLIIGAGPVGLTMAAELARYGLWVRIVDKAPAPTDKSKALVLWSRTLEMMDRMGCSASFVDLGFKVTAASIVDGNRQLAKITLDGVDSPHPYALMLPQSDTERLLTQHLRTFGVEVERGVGLTQSSASPDAVAATLTGPDGTPQTIEASWLIACDGAHSTVRHQLGLVFVGDTLPSNWILADVHLSGVPHPSEISIYLHADGVLPIFPITQNRYRILADVPTPFGPADGEPTLVQVQAILDARGPGTLKASDPIWISSFHINERKIADYRVGRIFLAGDAAHIHSPAGGQGMNTGIQDACNLAWKLALVHHNLCKPEPLLSSYSTERSAVGDEVLKNAGRLTSFGVLHGALQQSLRNHLAALVFGIPAARHLAAETLTELSIGYPKSPLTQRALHTPKGPRAGERAPIRTGEFPVSSGSSPRFTLFAAPDDATSQLLALYANLLEPTLREPFHPDGLWLVRPDGYIALASSAADWPTVSAYLDQLNT